MKRGQRISEVALLTHDPSAHAEQDHAPVLLPLLEHKFTESKVSCDKDPILSYGEAQYIRIRQSRGVRLPHDGDVVVRGDQEAR